MRGNLHIIDMGFLFIRFTTQKLSTRFVRSFGYYGRDGNDMRF